MSPESPNNPGNSPKVSVIMNCLNCEKYLREAIDSVYAQTFKDWEIIFWDNNSTDNSAKIAKSYDEKLRYFKGNQTVTLGKARNLAIGHARGEFIAFLDCDDLWMPMKLEKQISAFTGNIGLVFSNRVTIYELVGGEHLFFHSPPPSGNVFRELLKNYFLTISSVVFRRDALDPDQSWWFPESFTYAEDADLFLRIAYQYPIAYIDEPLVKYRMHGTNMTYTYFELISREKLQVLTRLASYIPDFEKMYSAEIRYWRSDISYSEGKYQWRQGNRLNALKSYSNSFMLRPQLKIVLEAIAAIFLPYSAAHLLHWKLK